MNQASWQQRSKAGMLELGRATLSRLLPIVGQMESFETRISSKVTGMVSRDTEM